MCRPCLHAYGCHTPARMLPHSRATVVTGGQSGTKFAYSAKYTHTPPARPCSPQRAMTQARHWSGLHGHAIKVPARSHSSCVILRTDTPGRATLLHGAVRQHAHPWPAHAAAGVLACRPHPPPPPSVAHQLAHVLKLARVGAEVLQIMVGLGPGTPAGKHGQWVSHRRRAPNRLAHAAHAAVRASKLVARHTRVVA